MPVTYGRYASYPYSTTPPSTQVPPPCKALWDKLKECEARVYPNQSNCFVPRALYRLCVRLRR